MKLSDYVAEFITKLGIRHVFAISGGASLHLIHSLADAEGTSFVCPLHEQAGAMAADGYARVTNRLAAAVGTSGPGATNLLTGVCCAYYDSVPVLFLTGQVSTFRMKRNTGVRQIGFQETETIDIFRSVTKYAVQIEQPEQIRYELEKACHLALTGRPGPVLIDIPDNIQRAQIDPETLVGFVPALEAKYTELADQLKKCKAMALEAKRPVMVCGWGVRLADAAAEVTRLAEVLGFPIAPTWAVADLLPADHPLRIGTFGTHGTRFGNFAVQNADLLLSIGCRIDTKATGSPPSTFAREAKKIVVDIDLAELAKLKTLGIPADLLVCGDAREFVNGFLSILDDYEMPDRRGWLNQITDWKRKYPACQPSYLEEERLNPYAVVKTLSELSRPDEQIFVDTGCTIAWVMQGFEPKKGQRIYHDCNNTAMGWALPAAIGASLALDGRQILCFTGDGSLNMNIQELATVIRHRLPIKIVLLNNRGHGMIQQTQDQWLESNYFASSVDGGLPDPDYSAIARAYGFPVKEVSETRHLRAALVEALETPGPYFVHLDIDPQHRVIPQVRFGRPNEDPEPLLPRHEFFANMIVTPLEASRKAG